MSNPQTSPNGLSDCLLYWLFVVLVLSLLMPIQQRPCDYPTDLPDYLSSIQEIWTAPQSKDARRANQLLLVLHCCNGKHQLMKNVGLLPIFYILPIISESTVSESNEFDFYFLFLASFNAHKG